MLTKLTTQFTITQYHKFRLFNRKIQGIFHQDFIGKRRIFFHWCLVLTTDLRKYRILENQKSRYRLSSRNHMFNIISAKKTDVDEIRQLLCKVWTDTFHGILSEKIVTEIPLTAYDYQLLKSQLQNPSIKFLIAKNTNEKIVGVMNARQDEEMLYINRLYVDRAFQGQGIGIRLLDEMTNKFPSAKEIILEVVEKNTNGIKFYLKNGFNIIGKNKNQIKDNVLDVLVLQKEIKQSSS